jgi:hypothetical protein
VAQIIITVCDRCGVDAEIRGLPGPPLSTPDGLKAADLCPKCADNLSLDKYVELVSSAGRPAQPAAKTKKPVRPAAPVARNAIPATSQLSLVEPAEDFRCRYPDCGATVGRNGPLASPQARANHERILHGSVWGKTA